MKTFFVLLTSLIALNTFAEEAETKAVYIQPGVISVDVIHNGKAVKLQRKQDKEHRISKFYQKTARGKIQPMHPFAPHTVETIGELAMIDYVKKNSDGDDSLLIVDTRTFNWVALTGGIPTAINIPYTEFKNKELALEMMEEQFDVNVGEMFDFSDAKTLVMYCNGIWCGQTPAAIRALLRYGYPAAKIKYYRGGMNAWKSLGLKTITL